VFHVIFFAGFIDSNYEEKAHQFRKREQSKVDSLIKSGMQPDYARINVAREHADEYLKIRPSISLLLDHIDHIVKIAGIDHVGLGSDFDGIEAPPRELNGVEDFPKITEGLIQRGYSEKDIRKILGGNFVRVLKANEK
jgi:membrane dipeptidase